MSQTATPADLAAMLEVTRETCLKTFPRYTNIDKHLAAKGLAQDDLGIWRGKSTVVVFRKSSKATLDCEVWMAMDSKAKDVSDVLQAALPNLGVPILAATRRGIRLSATFTQSGATGTLKVEPLRGRTSKIVVSHEVGS